MKIKEITVSVKLSRNYQSYGADITAQIEGEENVQEIMGVLKATLKTQINGWIEEETREAAK